MDRALLDDEKIVPHLTQENLVSGVIKPAIDIFII